MSMFELVDWFMDEFEADRWKPYEGDAENIKEIAMIVAEVFKLRPDADVKIAGGVVPAQTVAEVFMKLTTSNVDYVIANYKRITYTINHTKTYLRTALYNSVFEGNLKVENQVSVDFPGWKR